MFERFTDRARRVVVLAQEESRMLNHNYIGTEHLLLGLLHEGEGVGAEALQSMGISLETVRVQVEEIIGQGQSAPPSHIPFTPRAKKVLELSLRESKKLGHKYLGTEHILLGLIREGEGVAAQVLQRLGAELSAVRQGVLQQLAASGVTEGTLELETEGEPIRLGARQAEAAKAPVCPRCRAPLESSAAHREIDIPGSEGESSRTVSVVFCGRCGTWLGTIPSA